VGTGGFYDQYSCITNFVPDVVLRFFGKLRRQGAAALNSFYHRYYPLRLTSTESVARIYWFHW